MGLNDIETMIDRMDSKVAVESLIKAVKKLFPVLDDEDRKNLIIRMFGEPGNDKILSMVHL
ncbi:MAG: hypothetical protein V1714_02125 [Pseudomonadota bacterium]